MDRFCLIVLAGLMFACNNKSELTRATHSSFYISNFHAGLRAQMNDNHQKAIDKFEYCIAENTHDDAVYYALYSSYKEMNDLDKSHENIEKAYQLDPANYTYARALSSSFQSRKNHTGAAELALKSIEKWPNNKALFYDAAFNFAKSHRPNKAIKVIEKLEKISGVSPETMLYKYNILLESKNASKAINLLKKANATFPKHPGILSYLVDYYFNQNEIDQGIYLLIELCQADPYNAQAAMYLGDFFLEKKDTSRAFSYYKQAINNANQLDAKTTADLFVLMKSQWNSDQDLLQMIQNSSSQFNDDPVLLSILGDFHMMRGNQIEALMNYKKVVQINPDLQVVWEEILAIEYELEQWMGLKNDASSFIELYPFASIGYYAKAIALMETEALSEAEKTLEKGLDIVIKEKLIGLEMEYLMGEIKLRKGELATGKKSIENILDEIPDNLFVLTRYFNASIVYLQNLPLAQSLEKKIQSLNISPIESLVLKIKLLIATEQYKEALDLIQDHPMQKENYKIIEFIGDLYKLQNQMDQAFYHWKLSISNGNHSDQIKKKLSIEIE